MSIINQALKKAQREQRLHSMQTLMLPTHPVPAPPQRLWWRVCTVTSGIVLGVGVLGYVWRVASPPPPANMLLATAPLATPSDTVPRPDTPESPRPGILLTYPAQPPRAPAATPVAQMTSAPQLQSSPRPVRQPITTAIPPATAARPAAPQPLLPRSPKDNDISLRAPAAAATPQPTLALTHFNRAIEVQAAGDLAQAAALLQQAIELDPTLKYAYNSLGNLHYQQQQYGEAVTQYQQALAVDPEYIQARINLGSAYMQLAQPEQAIAEFHQALQSDGDTSLAYYNLACVYARGGDSAQAVQYLQRAIDVEPQARVWAQTDADFNRIRTEPEFQRLLGPS